MKHGPHPKQRSKGTWYVAFEPKELLPGQRALIRKTETLRNEQDAKAFAKSPTHNVSRVDHALAILRESSLTLAIMSHVSALASVASKSFARRRLRLSYAMVRSTTQRRGKEAKALQRPLPDGALRIV